MPQLDKVTLFSQVFWLIFLYFFFFLLFLKYYLPQFSKLFKLRFYYATKSSSLVEKQFVSSKSLLQLLEKFKSFVNEGISTNLIYYEKMLLQYNTVLLGAANNIFIFIYTYSCLKFKLYKKLYL